MKFSEFLRLNHSPVYLGIEIVDEMDKVEDMQILARQKWKKRAQVLGMEVEEVNSENRVDEEN